MFENIRSVVVGAGFVGPAHVENLRRLGVTVAGILGVDEKESTAAQQKLGLPRAYKSFDEVLADTSVHVVHLAVPNILHYPLAKKALLAGKHVLCEKPLTMTSKQAAELVELVKSRRQAAGVCFNLRFYPVNLEAQAMVRRGEVGDIYAINGNYVQDWLLYDTDYNWRVVAEQAGELRSMSDLGSHWLDLMRTVTGLEVESVCADMKTIFPVRQRPKGEVQAAFTGKTKGPMPTEPVAVTNDDYCAVLLRFKGGALGSLYSSEITAGKKNCFRYEISGSKCALAWNGETPNELWIGRRHRPNEVLLRDPTLLTEPARHYTTYPSGHNEGYPDTFKGCFRAFYEYIARGDFSATPFFPTFADGHHVMRLLDAILKSYREQRWVTV